MVILIEGLKVKKAMKMISSSKLSLATLLLWTEKTLCDDVVYSSSKTFFFYGKMLILKR